LGRVGDTKEVGGGKMKTDSLIYTEFIDREFKKVKGATFFGRPIEKLSKKELIACISVLSESEQREIEESSRQRSFLLSLIPKK